MAKSTSKNQAAVMADASPSKYVSAPDRKNGPFDDYEVESALSTIGRAEKIKSNAALMREVRKLAKKQLADLQKASANL